MSSAGARLRAVAAALAAMLAVTLGAARGDGAAIAINPAALYPEGPLVVGETLYYAEMGADRVMRWDGRDNVAIWTRPGCGPTAVARGGEGTLIVLCHKEGGLARISADGATLDIAGRDAGGRRLLAPNAAVNDAAGGVYFSLSGLFSPRAEAEGAVLYRDRGGRLARVAEDIHYANGVALTPDGRTLYVSEHLSRRVLAFDVGAGGRLSGRRVFVALDDLEATMPERGWELGPDGLAVDRAGNLYIAEYGAAHLLVVDPGARLVATIPVAESYVTAMALADGDRRLYVTAPVSFANPAAPGKVYSLRNPAYRGD